MERKKSVGISGSSDFVSDDDSDIYSKNSQASPRPDQALQKKRKKSRRSTNDFAAAAQLSSDCNPSLPSKVVTEGGKNESAQPSGKPSLNIQIPGNIISLQLNERPAKSDFSPIVQQSANNLTPPPLSDSQSPSDYKKHIKLNFEDNDRQVVKSFSQQQNQRLVESVSPTLVSSLKKSQSPLKKTLTFMEPKSMATVGFNANQQTPPSKKDDVISANSSIINLKQAAAAPMAKAFDIKQDTKVYDAKKVSNDSLQTFKPKLAQAEPPKQSPVLQPASTKPPVLKLSSLNSMDQELFSMEEGSYSASAGSLVTKSFESSNLSCSQSNASAADHQQLEALPKIRSKRASSIGTSNNIKGISEPPPPRSRQSGVIESENKKADFPIISLQLQLKPGLRKMHTNVDKKNRDSQLTLPPINNSTKGGSKVSQASQASRQKTASCNAKARSNSRWGRSQQSAYTFAPQKSQLEDHYVKNNIQEEIQFPVPVQKVYSSQRIYSKEDYKTFSSLKSVLKPRMIYLIKDAKEQEEKEEQQFRANTLDLSERIQQSQTQRSQPGSSESNSIYSHCRSNYLESQESLAMDMVLDQEAFHIKPQSKPGSKQRKMMEEYVKTFQPDIGQPCISHRSENLLLPKDEFEQIRYTKHRPTSIDTRLSHKDNTSNKMSDFQHAKSPVRKNKIKRKELKNNQKDKKQEHNFNIEDEVSISEEEDGENLIIEGRFMYYFQYKKYFIVHNRKVYGYTNSSFNKLGFDNTIRQLAIWINEWPWFDRFIIVLIVVNSLGLGLLDYQYTNLTNDNKELELEIPLLNQIMEQSEVFFTVAFALEMIIKTISQGLIIDKNCYLRDYWNWLDAIVVVGSIIAYLPGGTNVTVLRTFRLFKPLRSLRTLPSMQELVVTLLESVIQLTNIFLLFEFALILFSILGLQIWRGLTYFHCRITPEPVDGVWPIAEDNQKVCGGFNQCDIEAGQVCGSLYDNQWKTLFDQSQIQPENQGVELNWGITNFDNIFSAYISMFQTTTLEGWYSLMTIFLDGYTKSITMIFFMAAILICYYLLVNLTLAVMVTNLRKQKEDEFNELIDRQVDIYNKIAERKKILQLTIKDDNQFSPMKFLGLCVNTFITFKDQQEPIATRYEYKIIVILWRIAIHPLYQACFFILIIINTAILASAKHEEATEEYLERRNRDSRILVVSNMAFLLECLIKMIALETKVFFKERTNTVDTLLCIFYTVLFVKDSYDTGKISFIYEDLYYTNMFSFLAALRLARVIIVGRSISKTLGVLLDCVLYTLDAIGNFLALLLIFLYVYSLLGMQLFAGRLKFDAEGSVLSNFTTQEQINSAIVPRSNFDNILQSFITVFQILLGERWNEIFYDCWKGSSGMLASAYFITMIFFGNIIMMNLFLAMLLGNFERASLTSQVASEEEKLKILMPTNLTQANSVKEDPEDNNKLRSILKEPKDFSSATPAITPAEVKKQRKQGRLTKNRQISSNNIVDQKIQNSKKNSRNVLIPLPKPTAIDSSFDSEQDLEDVREKYMTDKVDSEFATLDRRVSFVAYAHDNFFEIPFEGESDQADAFKLNHFYDEPCEELKQKQIASASNQKIGAVKGRARSNSSGIAELSIRGRKASMQLQSNRPSLLQLTNQTSASKDLDVGSNSKTFEQIKSFIRPPVNKRNTQILPTPLVQLTKQASKSSVTNTTPTSLASPSTLNSNPINLNKSIRQQQDSSIPGRSCSTANINLQQLIAQRPIQINNNNMEAEYDVNPRQLLKNKMNIESMAEEGSQVIVQTQKLERAPTGLPSVKFKDIIQSPSKSSNLKNNRPLMLTIQTPDNPLKLHQTSVKPGSGSDKLSVSGILGASQNMTDFDIDDEEMTIRRRGALCVRYMKQSSLLCCHKKSRVRKRLIMIVLGGTAKPLFPTIDELIDFYTQRISKKNKQEIQMNTLSSMSSDESDEEDQSQDELDFYTAKTESEKFLDDPNSSAYIEEVLRVQQSEDFDVANLREQAGQIKQMQEGGYYDHVFIGGVIKDGGMFFLTEKHDIRIQFPKWYQISINTVFVWFMNSCVILSSLTLAFEDPFLGPDSLMRMVLQVADICFTLIFVSEAVIKILALGFYKTSLRGKRYKAYIMDPWNRLDFLLVFVQVTDLFKSWLLTSAESQAFVQSFKALKAMRALRPLRMISRFKGLRIAMNTVVNSGQQILNVVFLTFTVIIIFSVFGVHMFKGQLFQCVIDGDTELAKSDDRIQTKQDCIDLGYIWQNQPNNFDDIFNSIANLMVFMTNEGWVTVMVSAIDSRGLDLQPKLDSNRFYYLYFIMYMIVSHVFILNLFVGVIIERFNNMHDRLQGYTHKTVQMRKWIGIQRLMMKQKLQTKWFVPHQGIQRTFALVSISKPFEFFIYLVIVCNVVVLAMPYHGMSDFYRNFLEQLGLAFSIIYNIEAFIKLLGLRGRYFHDGWNIMDLFIVISSDLGLILATYTDLKITVMIPVIRALRVARVLKLVRGSQGLKMLVEAISTLFLNLINILGLMLLLVFIFAVLGVNIFHGTMYKEYYNEYTNFRNFENALLLLLRVITGEGWNLIMNDLALSNSNEVQCINHQTFEDWEQDGIRGCGSQVAFVFFITFVVLSQMVFINLFIAFVLQAYMHSYEVNSSAITVEDYAQLTKLWSDYDPKALGLIDPQDVSFLVYELVEPLGKSEDYQDIMKKIVDQNENEEMQKRSVLQKNQRYVIKVEKNMILPVKKMTRTLNKMKLPIYHTMDGNKCHFKDVCICLTKSALKEQGFLQEGNLEEDAMLLTEWHATYDSLKTQIKRDDTDSGSFWAGLFIARLFKQIQVRLKHKAKKAECISEFNKKKEYSKKLRRQEEEERVEQEMKDWKEKKLSKKFFNQDELKRFTKLQQVKFKFEDEKEEESVCDSADVDAMAHALKGSQLIPQFHKTRRGQLDKGVITKKKNVRGKRDLDRSAWWKPITEFGSSQKQIKNWIKINDIRYGIDQQRERQARLQLLNQYQPKEEYSLGQNQDMQFGDQRLKDNSAPDKQNFYDLKASDDTNVASSPVVNHRYSFGEMTPITIGSGQRSYERRSSMDTLNSGAGLDSENPMIRVDSVNNSGHRNSLKLSATNSLSSPDLKTKKAIEQQKEQQLLKDALNKLQVKSSTLHKIDNTIRSEITEENSGASQFSSSRSSRQYYKLETPYILDIAEFSPAVKKEVNPDMAKAISFNPKFSHSQEPKHQNDLEQQQPITIQTGSLKGVQLIEEEKNQQIMQKLVNLMPSQQSLDRQSAGSQSQRSEGNQSHRQTQQKTDFYNNGHRDSQRGKEIENDDVNGQTSEEDDRFVELHIQSEYSRSASNNEHKTAGGFSNGSQLLSMKTHSDNSGQEGQEIVMRDNLMQDTSLLQKSNTQEIRGEDEESLAYSNNHNQDNHSQKQLNNHPRQASNECKNAPQINIYDEDNYSNSGPQNSYQINNSQPQKQEQNHEKMQSLQTYQNYQQPRTRLTVLTEEKTDYADRSSAQSYPTSSVNESEKKKKSPKDIMKLVPITIQNFSRDEDISKLEQMISDTSGENNNNSSSQSVTENSNDKEIYR